MFDFRSSLFYSLASAAVAPLLFGYHLAELNAPEAAIRCMTSNSALPGFTLAPCIRMSTSDYSLVTSIFAFGGLLGALLGGPVGNRWGRRGALQICSVGFALGGLVMALANNVGVMVLGRLISGIASGAAVVITPLYIHDLAPRDKKGSFGAITQISVNVGILLTQTEGLWLSKERLWRIILAAGGILGVLQFILLLCAVESPKWLYTKGDMTGAAKALKVLRGYDLSDSEVEQEYSGHDVEHTEEGRRLLDEEDNGHPENPSKSPVDKVSLWAFLTKPEYRMALIAVVGIMFAQQLSGINAIIMYGVSVLRDLLPNSAALVNVFISLVNLFFTITASRFFDSFGRKPILITSILLMGLNSFLLGIGMTYHIPVLSAVATVLFVASFSIGLGPIPWMVAAETVPFNASGAAQSISLAANWIGTFIVSYGFPILAQQVGKGNVFFLFFVISLISAIFVEFYIPETKGKDVREAWEEHEKTIHGLFDRLNISRYFKRVDQARQRVD